MASKIGKGEWKLLYLASGVIDAIQIIIDFIPPVGEAINEVADIIIGVGLLAYFQLRGVSMFQRLSRVVSLLGVAGLEELTGGLAPAWIADVWYIHKTVKQEEAEIEAQNQEEMMRTESMRQALNRDGVRQPRTITANTYSEDQSNTGSNSGQGTTRNIKPLNIDGVRIATNIDTQTRTGTSGTNRPINRSVEEKIRI